MIKKLSLLGILFFFTLSASGNADLEKYMKDMGAQFKVIGIALQGQTVTAAEVEAIEKMQRSIAAASLIYPEVATNDAEKLKYSNLMAQLMDKSFTMEDQMVSFIDSGQPTIQSVFATFGEMNEIRKEGHNLFKVD